MTLIQSAKLNGLDPYAILGGILGEGAFRPYFYNLVVRFYQGPWAETLSFALFIPLPTEVKLA